MLNQKKKKIFDKTLKIAAILLLGILGGMLFQLFILPGIVNSDWFLKLAFGKKIGEKMTIIQNPVQKIFIQENNALQEVVEKVKGAVIAVGLNNSCGFSLTSDGLAIVPAQFTSRKQSFIYFNGKKVKFLTLSKDEKNNLALIKVEGQNLKTVDFILPKNTKFGERVFLIGANGEINEGIIKSAKNGLLKTNILEEKSFNNCPLFNIEGKFVGLAKIGNSNLGSVSPNLYQLFIIPVSKIRTLAGL